MNAPPSVRVRNLQRKLRVGVRELQAFADQALPLVLATRPPRRREVLPALEQVDVLLVSDARIAALHVRFMDIEGPTDVITFQHGEIFVSTETAAANARRFHSSVDREIRLYLVHGLLHLAGFDDKTPAAARLMAATQQKVLAAANRASQ